MPAKATKKFLPAVPHWFRFCEMCEYVDNFSGKRLSGIYGFAKLALVAKKERSSLVLMLQSYFMK
jgi:hypothetical protein